jgi:hypothetical protein
MKRATDTTARIWQAIRRIEGRGERPTNHSVRAELQKLHGAGGSFREVSPVVAAWREEVILKAGRRIDAAVAALAALAHDVEREEVMRRYRQSTGDHLRLAVTAKLVARKLA